MNLGAVLLAPIMLLISAVGGREEQGDARGEQDSSANAASVAPVQQDAPQWPIGVIRSFAPDSAWQVHIEQRMTIRIAPRAAMPVPRDMFAALPQSLAGPRFSERKIGKCLPSAGIVGVEPNGPNNLILFMRDRRMINAELEHSCLARSFYSGFYLSRSGDGNLCVDRDTLLSRSGTACKLSRIRQLIEVDD
jgi:hypothetical protein